VSGSLKLSVVTGAVGEPCGFDSAITRVPRRLWHVIDGDRALDAKTAGRELRGVSEKLAAAIGERLHHAEWTITSDPAEVRTLGLMHDCPSCRAGVDQALAFLRDNPGGELAVGQLWWARR